MKNIWLFNHYASSPNHSGLTRHYDIARNLSSSGHNVTIFCTSFIHYKYYDVIPTKALFYKEQHEGVNFIYLKSTSYSNNGIKRIVNMLVFAIHLFIFSLFYAIKNKKPHAIYSSSPHLLTPLVGCIVSKILSVPHVMEVRDLWPETFIMFGKLKRNSILAKMLCALEKFCYRNSDSIITTLPGAHKYMTQVGVNTKKIHHITNGVDLALFDKNIKRYNIQDLLDFSLHQGKFIVCYTGAHGVANDLDRVLDLANSVLHSGYANKIHFLLVGDGAEKTRLVARAGKENINNIFFYPSLNKKYIPSLLKCCDCTLFLLHDSPLFSSFGISPNKLADYLAAGVPILQYLNSYNDIVSDSGAGYSVTPNSSNGVTLLREALFSLYEMPKEKRKTLGKNGRIYAEKHHDIKVLASYVESILTSAIDRH